MRSMTSPLVTARSAQSASSTTACMNSSVTRTELLAFWYCVEWLSLPSRSMSKPASRSTRALRSSTALHQMKSCTSGWSALRMTIFAAPGRDRVDHPVCDLAQGALALDGPQLSPEVLLGHDVGGVLRPADGELDARLLEGHRAVPEVRDAGVAPLPEDLVVGVHIGS